MYELNAKHPESDLATDSTIDLPIHDVSHRISALTEEDLKVWGTAYYISPEHVEEVKEYLDEREQDGYSTHRVLFNVHSLPELTPETKEILDKIPRNQDGDLYIESMIYIGTIDNESFVGPEDISNTADIIRTGKGPSGLNFEYLNELAKAVRSLDPQSRSRDYYLEDLTALSTPNSS